MKKKMINLVLIALLLVGCKNGDNYLSSSKTSTTLTSVPILNYEIGDENAIYNEVLSDFKQLMDEANLLENEDEKLIKYAEAEATLLDAAIILPTYTNKGDYYISKIANKTIYNNLINNGLNYLDTAYATKENILTIDQNNIAEQTITNNEFDVEKYLKANNYEISNNLIIPYNNELISLDVLSSNMSSDLFILSQCYSGLIKYDIYGNIVGDIAINNENNKPYLLSENKKIYTFKLNENAKWYNYKGEEIDNLVADDFVVGFQHMLDCQGGLEKQFKGIIENVNEYLNKKVDFSEVGIKALDEYTLQISLVNEDYHFIEKLALSCLLPINKDFYESNGGVYGIDNYFNSLFEINYALPYDLNTICFNGPFYISEYEMYSKIKLVRNNKHCNLKTGSIDEINFVYDEDDMNIYNNVINSSYGYVNLTNSIDILNKSNEDKTFEKYAYLKVNNLKTNYITLNLNRSVQQLSTSGLKTNKSTNQIFNTWLAIQNKNFRKALLHAIDKEYYKNMTREIKNIFTNPNILKLKSDITINGKTFIKNTSYGDIVQYFCDLNNSNINVCDGANGYYNPSLAQSYFKRFKQESSTYFNEAIILDLIYIKDNQALFQEAKAIKESIENSLGKENIKINLIEASVQEYYEAVYINKGKDLFVDISYNNSFTPEYLDVSAYLDDFLVNNKSSLLKLLGLY